MSRAFEQPSRNVSHSWIMKGSRRSRPQHCQRLPSNPFRHDTTGHQKSEQAAASNSAKRRGRTDLIARSASEWIWNPIAPPHSPSVAHSLSLSLSFPDTRRWPLRQSIISTNRPTNQSIQIRPRPTRISHKSHPKNLCCISLTRFQSSLHDSTQISKCPSS